MLWCRFHWMRSSWRIHCFAKIDRSTTVLQTVINYQTVPHFIADSASNWLTTNISCCKRTLCYHIAVTTPCHRAVTKTIYEITNLVSVDWWFTDIGSNSRHLVYRTCHPYVRDDSSVTQFVVRHVTGDVVHLTDEVDIKVIERLQSLSDVVGIIVLDPAV